MKFIFQAAVRAESEICFDIKNELVRTSSVVLINMHEFRHIALSFWPLFNEANRVIYSMPFVSLTSPLTSVCAAGFQLPRTSCDIERCKTITLTYSQRMQAWNQQKRRNFAGFCFQHEDMWTIACCSVIAVPFNIKELVAKVCEWQIRDEQTDDLHLSESSWNYPDCNTVSTFHVCKF